MTNMSMNSPNSLFTFGAEHTFRICTLHGEGLFLLMNINPVGSFLLYTLHTGTVSSPQKQTNNNPAGVSTQEHTEEIALDPTEPWKMPFTPVKPVQQPDKLPLVRL